MYSSVSPGVAPAAPVSVTMATLFCVAMDFAVSVCSAPAGLSETAMPEPSRLSSGVHEPLVEALFSAVASLPLVALTMTALEESMRGT